MVGNNNLLINGKCVFQEISTNCIYMTDKEKHVACYLKIDPPFLETFTSKLSTIFCEGLRFLNSRVKLYETLFNTQSNDKLKSFV
jgi:hypothetical protein